MSNKYLSLTIVLLGLLLGGCSKQEEAGPAAVEPASLDAAQTVEAQAAALRKGDLLGFLNLALPPERFQEMQARWPERIKQDPATEEEKREFAEAMAKMTAEGAEEKLFAELEPQLAKAEAEMGAQLPLMVGMGRGFAVQAINQSEQLSGEQKQQAVQFVDAFARWIESAQPFDRERARKALASMVATARKLGIKTLDEVEAMDFETAMRKAGEVYLGVRDVLKVYGLDLDAALASVQAEVKSVEGDQAVVVVRYTLFDQPLSFETRMTRREGRWYGSEALREFERVAKAEASGGSATTAAEAGVEKEPEPAPAAPGR